MAHPSDHDSLNWDWDSHPTPQLTRIPDVWGRLGCLLFIIGFWILMPIWALRSLAWTGVRIYRAFTRPTRTYDRLHVILFFFMQLLLILLSILLIIRGVEAFTGDKLL
jgi:hypothetical protein